jgi:tetratricopeptide (TPR) repeat protein
MSRFVTARFLACSLVLASVAATGGCSATKTSSSSVSVPLFEGLGQRGRPITTSSRDAQVYFDQGLSFLFAFNHDEAIRSFRRATELDPKAAMAWWGISIANGPHINFPMMLPEQSAAASAALSRAQAELDDETAVERDLVQALAARYSDPPPADRTALDTAYADAMRAVWKKHPQDADVGALFAEAMMDLRPWNQWTPQGKAQPGTEEVLTTLDEVLALKSDHPLALHLYIHAVEASPEPGRADVAANRLRDLQPGLGHLVHMPSHIDVRRGRWSEAVKANAKAMVADDRYRAISPEQRFYRIYMAHNHHMLAFAAMMIGQRAEAVQAIDSMVATMPEQWKKEYAFVSDGFLAMPLEVRLRFGMWNDVLAAKDFEPIFPVANSMRLYSRGVAYAALGDTKSARTEQAAFRKAKSAVTKESIIGNNIAPDIVAIADRVLEGEILYREGKREAGFAALRQAVALEDKLRYDEPPAWILPSRHTLGAAYLDAGRWKDAEKVFRTDLEKLPGNGWSLFGLAKSLRMQKRLVEAAKVDAEFQKAWANADTEITSPCACLAEVVSATKAR